MRNTAVSFRRRDRFLEGRIGPPSDGAPGRSDKSLQRERRSPCSSFVLCCGDRRNSSTESRHHLGSLRRPGAPSVTEPPERARSAELPGAATDEEHMAASLRKRRAGGDRLVVWTPPCFVF